MAIGYNIAIRGYDNTGTAAGMFLRHSGTRTLTLLYMDMGYRRS
jgi:hypothetical protein